VRLEELVLAVWVVLELEEVDCDAPAACALALAVALALAAASALALAFALAAASAFALAFAFASASCLSRVAASWMLLVPGVILISCFFSSVEPLSATVLVRRMLFFLAVSVRLSSVLGA
jgi:hypothetical protein